MAKTLRNSFGSHWYGKLYRSLRDLSERKSVEEATSRGEDGLINFIMCVSVLREIYSRCCMRREIAERDAPPLHRAQTVNRERHAEEGSDNADEEIDEVNTPPRQRRKSVGNLFYSFCQCIISIPLPAFAIILFILFITDLQKCLIITNFLSGSKTRIDNDTNLVHNVTHLLNRLIMATSSNTLHIRVGDMQSVRETS